MLLVTFAIANAIVVGYCTSDSRLVAIEVIYINDRNYRFVIGVLKL